MAGRKVRELWSARNRPERAGAGVTPLHLVGDREVAERVQRATGAPPARQREIIMLARFQGLPQRQIAEVLGTSPHTVAYDMRATLAMLCDALRGLLHVDPTAESGTFGGHVDAGLVRLRADPSIG